MERAPIPGAARPQPFFVIPLIISTAFLMEALDSTVITASLPAMAADFGVTPLRLNLAITSYVLSLAIFIPISGWIADRFGARSVFLAAISIFTAGSILCGVSTSLPMLVAARVLQGFGGALMTPVGRLIMLRAVPKEMLISAIAYMTTPVLVGPLLGPLVGGFLTTYASWHWIFLINVPIGLLGIACTLYYIARTEPEAPRPFDFPGFGMCAGALLVFQLGLENFIHPLAPLPVSLAAFAATAVLLVVYSRYAARRAHPALDLSLLQLRPFRAGVLHGGLSRIGLNAVPFLLQLQLQVGFGYTALEAGSLVFLTAFGAMSLKPMTRWVLRQVGFRRLLVVNGMAGGLLTAGFYFLSPERPLWLVAIYIFAFGLSRSLQFNTINALIYAEVERQHQSASVSLASVGQQLTMGLGISLSAGAVALLAGHDALPGAGVYALVFVLMGVLPIVSGFGFLRLKAQDGQATSGYRPRRMIEAA